MTAPRLVYFSVRTIDDSSLEDVGRRVEKMLGLRFTSYEGPRFSRPVLECNVLGIWVVLGPVKSLQDDAPSRYQLQGRQPLDFDSDISDEYHHIDDYVLHILNQHEPGRWYLPKKREVRIDVGLDEGRIQDLPEWKG